MDVKNSARTPIRYPAASSSAGTPVLLAKTSHGSRVTGDWPARGCPAFAPLRPLAV